MEDLITILGLKQNDLIFIIGIAVTLLITLITFLLTRDKAEKEKEHLHQQTDSIQPEIERDGISSTEMEQTVSVTNTDTESETITDFPGQSQYPIEEQNIPVPDSGTIQEEAEKKQAVIEDTDLTEIRKQPPQQLIETPKEEEIREDNFFSRLRSGLSKTHTGLIGKLDLILGSKEISDETWDEFEELLVTSDLGISTTMKLRQEIEKQLEKKSSTDPVEIKNCLKSTVLEILQESQGKINTADVKPFVIMVAGVNGVGKTTTIGKLAYKFKEEGKKVMVAAADTFRAAAVDQLEIWSKRVDTDFIKGQMGSDPSAVAYDAVKAAISRKMDILIIDTAGRLHTRANLMEELKKLRKIVGRELQGAPHETILVLDATTGQNAIQQAKLFDEALELTGIALTKLDGTAKGGVIVSIANELKIPVKYIGIGESLRDLRDFNAEEFVEALFMSDSDTIH